MTRALLATLLLLTACAGPERVVDRTVAPPDPPPALKSCAPVPADRPLRTSDDVARLADEALAAHGNCRAVVEGWSCWWARAQAAIENRPAPACAIVGEAKK